MTATLTGVRVNVLPCATDPEAWYDDNHIQAAKQACTGCPVREGCLTLAVDNGEPWGVWGGHTPAERQRLTTGTPARTCDQCRQVCVPRPGRTRCDVCAPGPASVDDDAPTIARLAADSWTDRMIAEHLGWTLANIKGCRFRHDIPSLHLNGAGPKVPTHMLKPCGTHAAYRRHLRRREPIDDACRVAESQRRAAVDARRKAALAS